MQNASIVFLDRDGTINIDTGYVRDASKVELIEGAAVALGDLKRAGCELIIVSNQSGIGRGLITEAEAEEVSKRVQELLTLEDSDALFSKALYCPHSPDDGCDCRKPKTGLVDFQFSQAQAYIIGDKLSDIELGANLGIAKELSLIHI